ncbi:MAG: hypothetical protein HY919_02985 [Elusimicrobia bacterium]|nr:hypothetical protein [Elusimicrobiota bacterium]
MTDKNIELLGEGLSEFKKQQWPNDAEFGRDLEEFCKKDEDKPITDLKRHQEFMRKMFAKISVGEAEKMEGFIAALYGTENFLVKEGLEDLKAKEATDGRNWRTGMCGYCGAAGGQPHYHSCLKGRIITNCICPDCDK